MTTEAPDTIAPKEDWSINIEDLKIGELIGAGSFGRVYKAKYMGIDVAVKEILDNLRESQEFEHEVAMLKFGECFSNFSLCEPLFGK